MSNTPPVQTATGALPARPWTQPPGQYRTAAGRRTINADLPAPVGPLVWTLRIAGVVALAVGSAMGAGSTWAVLAAWGIAWLLLTAAAVAERRTTPHPHRPGTRRAAPHIPAPREDPSPMTLTTTRGRHHIPAPAAQPNTGRFVATAPVPTTGAAYHLAPGACGDSPLYLQGREDFGVELWCRACAGADIAGVCLMVYGLDALLEPVPDGAIVVTELPALLTYAAQHDRHTVTAALPVVPVAALADPIGDDPHPGRAAGVLDILRHGTQTR